MRPDSITIFGSTGFVGTNLLRDFNNLYNIYTFKRGNEIKITGSVVINLVGKAHDVKNVANPEEYYEANTEFSKRVFDAFLASDAKTFITLSSVKAVADQVDGVLTEHHQPKPVTHYGKSKLLSDEYILSHYVPADKRVYVLRPCMIHGPGNKANLNLLYKLVSKHIPWPLAAFQNKRSFCSIGNLIFVIKELMEEGNNIPSGVYNIADDVPVSTNDLIVWISESQAKKPFLLNVPAPAIKALAKLGDKFRLPLNSDRLQKLTESYVVSNEKIKAAIGKPLPLSSKEGLLKTFYSFNKAQ